MVFATERQIEAIAYELAQLFFKRSGNVKSLQDVDDLAAEIAAAIKKWLSKKTRG